MSFSAARVKNIAFRRPLRSSSLSYEGARKAKEYRIQSKLLCAGCHTRLYT